MDLETIHQKLISKKAADRTRAAKAIAKELIHSLKVDLHSAYLKEIKEERTWQTQVEMINALGKLNAKEALPEIEAIVRQNKPHDMITVSASAAFIRLNRKSTNDAQPTLELLDFGSVSVISGALQPLAVDQMTPSESEIKELLKLCWDINKHKDRIGQEYGLVDSRLYPAAACANWDRKLTEGFLNHCIETAYNINRFDKPIRNDNLITVCENSLKGKFSKSYI
jgi:hypothetical protein